MDAPALRHILPIFCRSARVVSAQKYPIFSCFVAQKSRASLLSNTVARTVLHDLIRRCGFCATHDGLRADARADLGDNNDHCINIWRRAKR